MNDKKRSSLGMSSAVTFVVAMGVVSLLSDMTHEGARSIYGAFLNLAGASAAAIGFATGFGELMGYALRLITGSITDRMKNYWTMTFIGYGINMLAIPALALVPKNGWKIACALIIFERIGKAIRHPAKNTMVSFAASAVGEGKSFAVLEFMDQIGAFAGPFMLFVIMAITKGGHTYSAYSLCFLVLGLPAAATLLSLYLAHKKFPHPEEFEKDDAPQAKGAFHLSFITYMAAISLLAFGFADFPLITMHFVRHNIMNADYLPLAYAWAMAVDAFSALAFGWAYDRFGINVLAVSSLISAPFAIFAFASAGPYAAMLGVTLWGTGMGAQESILKSVVTSIVPKDRRASGFGVFQTAFGIAWFFGSWLMGALYDMHISWMVMVSTSAQLLSVPMFMLTNRLSVKKR